MQYRIDTLDNNPDYLERLRTLNRASWPKFLLHGDTPSWDRLFDVLSGFALLLMDTEGDLAGAGLTIPVNWDGDIEHLPESIESIICNGLNAIHHAPNTLMAVAALVDRRYRGRRMSTEILTQMKHLAHRNGLKDLLVPVRPTWKARYPLQSIERYASWRREDGWLYDPWLRTHERLGAKLIKCVDCTYSVQGSIEEWQTWTGMIFPESGSYIVDGALQPVRINRKDNMGIYRDPNVWMHHKVL